MNLSSPSEIATFTVPGHEPRSFQILEGTAGEAAVDMTNFRRQTGLVALDYGYNNTASCESAITFLDGERAFSAIAATPSRSWPNGRASSKSPICS